MCGRYGLKTTFSTLAKLLRACDCGQWSQEDAQLWWEEFGEAARSEIVSAGGGDSEVRSGLEVELGDTRG